MGPNGSGKSTLANVISGHEDYEVTKGSIYFDNKEINDLGVDERAHEGIFMSFQYPVEIPGVTVTNFTGQTFQNTSATVDLDPATNSESTSGNVISSIDYTYANLDGASTFLSGGTPVALSLIHI